MDYAIIEACGKQYRVEAGARLRVDTLPTPKGEVVTLDKILLLRTEAGLKVGNPHVTGAAVTAEVTAHDRGPKIIVFKKRSKKTYKKTIGHRQNYTELLIKSITG